MSLLTICHKLAENVGLAVPEQVITSPAREWAEAVTMSEAAGDEIARRADFGALSRSVSLAGDGTAKAHTIAADFSRIIPGIGVTYGPGIVRPLTQAEWASLEPVVGVPRYFLLESGVMHLWPYLESGAAVSVRYQSKNWCANGTAEWSADTDEALVSEDLITKGLIARWRRQKGMEFADYEAEYEADLADIARFDDRSRI